jgi:hypothetical protein
VAGDVRHPADHAIPIDDQQPNLDAVVQRRDREPRAGSTQCGGQMSLAR